MGFLRVLNKPYVNPFYHSQADEEEDDVVQEEKHLAQTGTSASSSVAAHPGESPPHYQEAYDEYKAGAEAGAGPVTEKVDPHYQEGVQKSEGVTLAWNKRALWMTYIWYVIPFNVPAQYD